MVETSEYDLRKVIFQRVHDEKHHEAGFQAGLRVRTRALNTLVHGKAAQHQLMSE